MIEYPTLSVISFHWCSYINKYFGCKTYIVIPAEKDEVNHQSSFEHAHDVIVLISYDQESY